MLHFVHQQVSKCVCLLFGVEQVLYNVSLEFFLWKQLLAAAENSTIRAVRVNQNSKFMDQSAQQQAETHHKALYSQEELQIKTHFKFGNNSQVQLRCCQQNEGHMRN